LEHLEWWGKQERGIFNDTGEFAAYIVESLERGKTDEFEVAFDTVERIVREGDDEARGAAITGVLEDIQVMASHHSFGPDAFIPWLGPLSRQAWLEIEVVWAAGGNSLAGVIRLERRLEEAGPKAKAWWQFWRRA
jgi:hypothetical protein